MAGATYSTYTWANPGTSGTWDTASNWTPGTIDMVNGALAPSDDLVLPGDPSQPYTTYINAFGGGGDIIDNLTIGNGATVALAPSPATTTLYLNGLIDVEAGGVLDLNSPDAADGPMQIVAGDPSQGNPPNPEAGAADIFVDGTLLGSGYIDSSINVILGSGTIISEADPYGNGTGLLLDTNLGGNLTVITEPGASLTIGGTVGAGVTFETTSGDASIRLTQADTFTGTISGLTVATSSSDVNQLLNGTLPSDIPGYIDLAGVADGSTSSGAGTYNTIAGITNASYTPDSASPTSGGQISVTLTPTGQAPETITLNVSGDYVNGADNQPDPIGVISDGNGGYDLVFYTTCFLPGTGILTPGGEVPVETLSIGDEVVTLLDGAPLARRVKWIGYRKLPLTEAAIKNGMAPIRVRRGAIGEGLPTRDLLVSGPHCLFIGGNLIPAKLLVNEMTIVREESLASVEYYHVELDRHSVIVANGVATESYLDTGNRCFFSNAGAAVALNPTFDLNASLGVWETDACAPLVVAADAVFPVWQALADHAISLGYQAPEYITTNDPDLHLMVDGKRLDAVSVRGRVHTFLVPAGGQLLVLASRHVAQNVLRPYVDDPREVGVPVRCVTVRDADHRIDYAADHPAFVDGWHAPDIVDIGMWRWTAGRGVLPVGPLDSPTIIEITVNHGISYVIDRMRPAASMAA